MDLLFRPPLSVHSIDGKDSTQYQRHKKNGLPSGIPRNLSFENIVNGELCFPCRLRDFMNYLRFVEHSVENLKFYLWWKDYSKRFEALPLKERMLSPVYVEETTTSKGFGSGASAKNYGVGGFSMLQNNVNNNNSNNTLDPRAKQPLRAEVGRICSLFILPGSPLELNLSTRDRNLTLQALHHTTHPSAFLRALRSAEESMRFQSHPNFVLRLLETSDPERISYGRAVGITLLLLGVTISFALVLSHVARFARVVPALLVGVGAILILNSRRNICLRLFSSPRRGLNVWDDPEDFGVDMAPECCRENTPSTNTSTSETVTTASLDSVEKQQKHYHAQPRSSGILAGFDHFLGFNNSHDTPPPSPQFGQPFGHESFLKRTLALRKRITDEEDTKVHRVMVFQHVSIFLTAIMFVCLMTFPLPRFGYY